MSLDHDPKYLRGKILDILMEKRPHFITDSELLLILGDENVVVSAPALAAEIDYLHNWPEVENGYIQVEERRSRRTGARYFVSRITPRGVNQLSPGAAPDPQIGQGEA